MMSDDQRRDAGESAAARGRTVTWSDPAVTVAAAHRLSGLAFLEGVRDGTVPAPPIANLLGYRVVEARSGAVVLELEPGEHLVNPLGVVHGGALAVLLETAVTCAINSELPEGLAFTTVGLNVNYVRPVSPTSGPLRCEAQRIHIGRRLATAEGRVVDGAGKVYAHAVGTCLVRRREPDAAPSQGTGMSGVA